MSNFANELNTLLKEKRVSAAELARRTGITAGQISRLKNGVQVWVDPNDIVSIVSALTPNKGEKFDKLYSRLLYAHLLDESKDLGAKYIHIELLSQADQTQHTQECLPVLPPRMKENICLIAHHISGNRNVRDLVESVANLCRGSALPEPASSEIFHLRKKNAYPDDACL